MIKRQLYAVEGEKLSRQRRFCPRCGPGVFLAEHKDRFTCGKCSYTEFKKDSKAREPKKEAAPKAAEQKEEKKSEKPKEE